MLNTLYEQLVIEQDMKLVELKENDIGNSQYTYQNAELTAIVNLRTATREVYRITIHKNDTP